MKIWKLTPTQSTGYVRIRANSETRAREIAMQTFLNTKVHKVMHNPDWSSLSWNDPNVVACQYEDDDISNVEGILDIV
jgi:hypothetical protein